MAKLEPIIARMWVGEDATGDCACPDTDRQAPQVRRFEREKGVESDCACPDSGMGIASPAVSGPWLCPPDLYRAPLPGGHEVAFAPAATAGVAVLNPPASRILDAFAVPRRLVDAAAALPEMLCGDVARLACDMADLGLIRQAGQAASCRTLPDTLTAWLHVTRRCTLHCAYCYAGRGDEDMDPATGRIAVAALIESAACHGFRAIKLKYAGGEPSLNLPLVLALHKHARSLAAWNCLDLTAVLLSNGDGLPESALSALHDAGIGLALSLDGIGPAHDALRGTGSFRRTAASLERAIALGMRPHVSITVTGQNAGELCHLASYVLDRDLPFNLNFYRDHGRPLPASKLRATDDELIDGVRAVLGLIEERLPLYSLAGALLDRCQIGAAHRHACGAGHSYVAIDPQGRIARCHMELDARHAVGHVGSGDPVAAIRTATAAWQNREVDDRRACRDCAWRYWCAGGCPLLAFRTMGRDDGPSPYCRVYRTLLPEVLRLEGLRLLKSGPPVA